MARPRTIRLARKRSAERDPSRDSSRSPSAALVTVVDPAGPGSEAYRTLRTNILHAQIDDPPKVILLTSPGSKEGKSTICANLGVALARADRSTLVVDCDLRGPAMHEIFGLDDSPGLPDALTMEDGLRRACQAFAPNLSVLAGGRTQTNPAELLGSRRFAELLGRARQEFDYVLLDAPPVDLASDAAILAAQADGALLAMDARKTSKAALGQAVGGLQLVGANVLGVVVNNVGASDGGFPLAGHANG